MDARTTELIPHPEGEQSVVEEHVATVDTFGGRVRVEWDATTPVTPLGQLPFFIDYLKQGGLFDAWVADCPLLLPSPNAPRKRDLVLLRKSGEFLMRHEELDDTATTVHEGI